MADIGKDSIVRREAKDALKTVWDKLWRRGNLRRRMPWRIFSQWLWLHSGNANYINLRCYLIWTILVLPLLQIQVRLHIIQPSVQFARIPWERNKREIRSFIGIKRETINHVCMILHHRHFFFLVRLAKWESINSMVSYGQ